MIPQIAEGNLNTTDVEVQFAKDKKDRTKMKILLQYIQ